MIGAILGGIVGSRFEFRNILSKDFDFITGECEFTDDTVMTCAVAGGIAEAFYGVPEEYAAAAEAMLDKRLLKVLHDFQSWKQARVGS